MSEDNADQATARKLFTYNIQGKKMTKDTYARFVRQAAPLPAGIVGKSRAAVRSALLYASATVNRSTADQFLRCLYCHYVFDDQINQFEKMISRLNWFSPVNLFLCIVIDPYAKSLFIPNSCCEKLK